MKQLFMMFIGATATLHAAGKGPEKHPLAPTGLEGNSSKKPIVAGVSVLADLNIRESIHFTNAIHGLERGKGV